MPNRIAAGFVFALAALTGVASAAESLNTAEFTRQAHLSIGTDGKVADVRFADPAARSDLLDKKLEALIRGWNFEPGKVEGQPMPTETTLYLRMEMQKNGEDSYAIRLLDAFTGAAWQRMSMPEYPQRELAYSTEAVVNVMLAVDASGTPSDYAIDRVVTNGFKQDEKVFAKAVLDAARQWRFQPERVGEHGVASHVRVPVQFCMQGSSWCARQASAAAQKGERYEPNQPVALDSQVKLKDQVAGTVF